MPKQTTRKAQPKPDPNAEPDIAITATYRPPQVSDQDVYNAVANVVWLRQQIGKDPEATTAALAVISRILEMREAARNGDWVALAS